MNQVNQIRVALYARVSTTNHGQDVGMQLGELREYAKHRGFQVVEEYTDIGVSGGKDSRPALNQMLADARMRKFDAIVIWRLDRLGRSLRHLVNLLADLESLGIALISLKDSLDFSTPSGRLMFQLVSAFSEFERNVIRERVQAGLKHAQAKGKKLGRPKVAVDTSKVMQLRAEGQSIARIAKQLGVSTGTIHSSMKNFLRAQDKIATNVIY